MYLLSGSGFLGEPPRVYRARLPVGLTPAQVRAGGQLFGKYISNLMPGVWQRAQPQGAGQVQSSIQQLMASGNQGAARQLARRFFGSWRQGYWRQVRQDPAAMQALRAAGLRFPEEDPQLVAVIRARTGLKTPVEERLRRLTERPPYHVDAEGKPLRVSIEHFRHRIVDDPRQALVESNLMLTPSWENSVQLEWLRRNLPPW
jgi:hypothetical protein